MGWGGQRERSAPPLMLSLFTHNTSDLGQNVPATHTVTTLPIFKRNYNIDAIHKARELSSVFDLAANEN